MSDLIDNITADLQKQIDSYKPAVEVSEVGTVIEAGDGIARVFDGNSILNVGITINIGIRRFDHRNREFRIGGVQGWSTTGSKKIATAVFKEKLQPDLPSAIT